MRSLDSTCTRKMILGNNRLEERIAEYQSGQAGSFMHPGVGQEALRWQRLLPLRSDDYMMCASRGRLLRWPAGIPLDRILCDLAGKEGGTNKGRGGADALSIRRGCWASGTLGGCFPAAATGLDQDQKLRQGRTLLLWRGTSNSSAACRRELVCGAKAARDLRVREQRLGGLRAGIRPPRMEDVLDRAKGYNMPGKMVDGNDVFRVYERSRGRRAPASAKGPLDRSQDLSPVGTPGSATTTTARAKKSRRNGGVIHLRHMSAS